MGRDSQSQRLGIKLQDGQLAKPGAILVRQRGTKIQAGANVKVGKDHTLFAVIEGVVKYTAKKMKKFDNQLRPSTIASVIPQK